MTAVRLPGRRGAAVALLLDGVPVTAAAGEMLAAAMMAAGCLRLRDSPRAGGPRGAFCLIGICQECLVRVDGITRQACQVAVRDGMVVTR